MTSYDAPPEYAETRAPLPVDALLPAAVSGGGLFAALMIVLTFF